MADSTKSVGKLIYDRRTELGITAGKWYEKSGQPPQTSRSNQMPSH